MIEVHMREKDMLDVGERDTQLGHPGFQPVERGGRARIHDRRLGAVDPKARTRPPKTEVHDIDRGNRHGYRTARAW
jgi:hypothetical protein